jgi:hypothetical protein
LITSIVRPETTATSSWPMSICAIGCRPPLQHQRYRAKRDLSR